MAADPDCIFCRIVAGDLPATIVAEDERTVAFLDAHPGTRGHSLVVPREHARDLHDVGSEDLQACAVAAQRLAARARDALGAQGINLVNSCGAAAWQTVGHFHIHVVPRYSGDGLRLPWTPGAGEPEDMQAVGALLAG